MRPWTGFPPPGPKIVTDQLLGGGARAVPLQVGALRDAYASGATQLVHGYFEKRRPGLHFEFVVEDAQTHKSLQTLASDGDPLPSLDRLAKQIDTGAHAFSSTNPEAVAAWAKGDYEKAVIARPGVRRGVVELGAGPRGGRREQPASQASRLPRSRRGRSGKPLCGRPSIVRNWNSCRQRCARMNPLSSRLSRRWRS